MSAASDDFDSSIKLSELSDDETVRFGVDLVSAARRNLGFLKLVAESDWLHQKHTIFESIRRYEELWMPLISDLAVGLTPTVIIPPLDVEWVWYCHTLNPVKYRKYCESRFSKLIGKAAIFDEENEEYALSKCKKIWEERYPSEPFENDMDLSCAEPYIDNEDIFHDVSKQRFLYTNFDEPYRPEIVYLIAAKQRYKGVLYVINKVGDKCSQFVPTSDIMLMLVTHLSYPTIYYTDCKEIECHIGRVCIASDSVTQEDIEKTKNLWEEFFQRPYEKAGGAAIGRALDLKSPVYWPVCDVDVNTKYKSMLPRFLLELCISVMINNVTETKRRDISKEYIRLRISRCHKDLKLDKAITNFRTRTWDKAWHMYCEFGTKGVILEIRRRGSGILKGSSLLSDATFFWNDLLRAPSLSLETKIDQDIRIAGSITPPVQASYLLKCVPDRVTDDSGAMISEVILRLNRYRPQEGRWLSRTVLDHAGREVFVIRVRMGEGIWRRGGEVPSLVKWDNRIIEIREGSWSYIEGSIGRAPERVVGTATPNQPPEGWQASWNFSTGNELLIRWSSDQTSISSLTFELKNNKGCDKMGYLLRGRKMQYQVINFKTEASSNESKELGDDDDDDDDDENENDDDDDDFVTLVRYTEEKPEGKATAILNWKRLIVEVLPEEDAVFVLLLCIAILKSVSEFKNKDAGNLLIRKRVKQEKIGVRDWGSLIPHPTCYSSSSSSFCYHDLKPWYWNAKMVTGPEPSDHSMQPLSLNSNNSPMDGGDELYKRGIFG